MTRIGFERKWNLSGRRGNCEGFFKENKKMNKTGRSGKS